MPNHDVCCGVITMPPRRNTRRRPIEEVYNDDTTPPNPSNLKILEAVQQAMNSMMPNLVAQVAEAKRQAAGLQLL